MKKDDQRVAQQQRLDPNSIGILDRQMKEELFTFGAARLDPYSSGILDRQRTSITKAYIGMS